MSFYPSLRGKGCFACLVYTDLNNFIKKVKKGYGLDEVKIVQLNKALEMIDSEKAKLIEKNIGNILKA